MITYCTSLLYPPIKRLVLRLDSASFITPFISHFILITYILLTEISFFVYHFLTEKEYFIMFDSTSEIHKSNFEEIYSDVYWKKFKQFNNTYFPNCLQMLNDVKWMTSYIVIKDQFWLLPIDYFILWYPVTILP